MKRVLLLTLFLVGNLWAQIVNYQQFQEAMSKPEIQELMESNQFKKILSSYPAGLPANEAEFTKFSRSIAFWKLKRNPQFKEAFGGGVAKVATHAATPKVEASAAPKEKTERELYLEQFMAKPTPTVAVTPTVEAPVVEEEADDDLETELKEIEKSSKELLKLAKPKGGQLDLEAAQKIMAKNMGGKEVEKLDDQALMQNPHIVVARMLAPFRKMSEPEVIKKLEDQTKENKFAAKVYKYIPLLPTFIARLLRDEKALPEIARTSVDKKRLMVFFALSVATIILGFIMKRMMGIQTDISKQFKNFIFRIFVLYTLRIGLFVYFFGAEFKPAASIFMRTFF